MFDLSIWLTALGFILGFALLGWLVSLIKNDVSIVDSMWSLMFVIAAIVYATNTETDSPRATIIVILVSLWAIRLAGYIVWRNHGSDEDKRYREIRANNEPGFRFKSLYIVFGLQGVLAWVISLPLMATINSFTPLGVVDIIGIVVFIIGFFFESVGDLQLMRFKKDPGNRDKVLDSGLWHYTRHPNYFGNFLIWWGFFVIGLSASGWWAIISPLLMTFLLLKVSGVALLEENITERRPKYADYIGRTNAFFPGPPQQGM